MYLMSETSRALMQSEMLHLKQYMISVPDSEASFKKITEILEHLKVA